MFTVTGTFSSSSSSSSSSTPSIPPSMAKCRAQKLETFGDAIDDITELNSTTTPNSTITAVQPVDKTATLATTATVINRNLSGNVDESSKSVHGIVASLIRAAEETRFQAPDKPTSLNLSNKKFQPQQPSTTATATITSEQQVLYHRSHF
ncbi:unnamed protein product [Onchocerca flexuosa]|uniref:Uncharacterized protein n=1 Tax=Onchocerca flexuosa TaxID=387005 RepID=A0A183H7U5_9BILA|nr:unnamed protein product [Onchocerca flexuosa]